MTTPVWVLLLEQLRKRSPRPVAPSTLERALGLTPASLARELTILRQHGYEPSTDAKGRLALPPDGPLCAQELQHSLRGHLVCRSIQVFPELPSTQDALRKEAARTDVGGFVVFAEHQTKGRGRFGRSWQSGPAQNLLFSVLLRLPRIQPSPSMVTVTASVAVCDFLAETWKLPAQIRWPNDILLGDRKIAGILVERTAPRNRPSAYLVGIGLNVNQAPDLDTATSLRDFVGQPVDRTAVALGLLRRLESWYQRLDESGVDDVTDYWRSHSGTLGRRVTLVTKGRRFTGRVIDVSPSEGLTIQMDDSLCMTFRAEQTSLLS